MIIIILPFLQLEWFPLSMSYSGGQLLVGDVNNFLHVIDPRHGEFSLLHVSTCKKRKRIEDYFVIYYQ